MHTKIATHEELVAEVARLREDVGILNMGMAIIGTPAEVMKKRWAKEAQQREEAEMDAELEAVGGGGLMEVALRPVKGAYRRLRPAS